MGAPRLVKIAQWVGIVVGSLLATITLYSFFVTQVGPYSPGAIKQRVDDLQREQVKLRERDSLWNVAQDERANKHMELTVLAITAIAEQDAPARRAALMSLRRLKRYGP